MKDRCQQCRSSKIGAEVIPGLLESIRKATSERDAYPTGKRASGMGNNSRASTGR